MAEHKRLTDYKRRITHTTPGPVQLTLRIGSGRIGIVADPDTATATVELSAPLHTPGAAAAAAATAEHHGAQMTVETPAVATAETVTASRISTPGGDITIGPGAAVVAGNIGGTGNTVHLNGAGRSGPFDHSVGASATVPPATSIYARTDGPILMGGYLYHVDATAGTSAYIRHAAHADITTDTGDITIGSAGELTATTRTGSITATVTGPATLTVAVRGDITVHVHTATHIVATTARGDITVHAHVPGVTTELRAINGTARVHTAH